MIFNLDERFKKVDKLYPVNNVQVGFNYWYWKLFSILLDMFEWEGLPPSLPSREIEIQLMLTGHCVVFEDNGELVTANTNVFGFDRYYYPVRATFANPKMKSKTLSIGEDCVIIYNNNLMNNVSYIQTDGSLDTFVCRYARMLADIESTINIYTVNTRACSYPVASNDKVMNSLKRFFGQLKNGNTAIISDDAIIQQFRNVDILGRNIKDGINDLLIARDKILEMFYREIGVKMYQPKKAQVNNEELEANDQLLLISHDDMLKARSEGARRLENLFGGVYGINPRVKLNERFNTSTDGVEGGEDNEEV